MDIKDFIGYNNYPIKIYVWDDVETPKGVVQIVHGMVEHARRYDDFANFLNAKGYIVIADDHRGHGETAKGELGIVPTIDNFNDTLSDLIMITKYAIETYKLPVTLFGHSYGSFLSQAYIQKSSELINGVVLSGSARQPRMLTSAGKILANLFYIFGGKDKPAYTLDKLAFGGYNRKFANEGGSYAWLSKNPANVKSYEEDALCGYIVSVGFYTSFLRAVTKLYTPQGLNNIRKDLPILIISGDMDPVGGFGKYVEHLRDTYLNSGLQKVKMKLYHDLRHEILNEKEHDEVYVDSLNFMDGLNHQYVKK